MPGSPARGRAARNILSNSAATAFGCAAQLVALVCLNRALSPADYALFLVASAAIGVAEVACDFGARTWAVREIALGANARGALRLALSAKGVYSLLTAGAFLALPLGDLDGSTRLLCAAIAITQLSADPTSWLLRGRGRLDAEAGITLLYRTAQALATIAAALWWGRLDLVLWAWLVCNLVRGLATAPVWLSSDQRDQAEGPAPPSLASVLAQTLPLGLSLFAAAMFHRVGVLTLSYTSTQSDVALFGTAHRVVSTATLIATSIAVTYYPMVAAAAKTSNPSVANRLVRDKLRIVTAVFVPMALVGVFALPPLAGLLFGEPFGDSVRLIAWLMPGLYLSAVNISAKYTLNSFGLDWRDTACLLIGLLAFLIGFACLDRWTGLPGCEAAAAAWVFSEATLYLAKRASLWTGAPAIGLGLGKVTAGFGALSAIALLRIVWS